MPGGKTFAGGDSSSIGTGGTKSTLTEVSHQKEDLVLCSNSGRKVSDRLDRVKSQDVLDKDVGDVGDSDSSGNSDVNSEGDGDVCDVAEPNLRVGKRKGERSEVTFAPRTKSKAVQHVPLTQDKRHASQPPVDRHKQWQDGSVTTGGQDDGPSESRTEHAVTSSLGGAGISEGSGNSNVYSRGGGAVCHVGISSAYRSKRKIDLVEVAHEAELRRRESKYSTSTSDTGLASECWPAKRAHHADGRDSSTNEHAPVRGLRRVESDGQLNKRKSREGIEKRRHKKPFKRVESSTRLDALSKEEEGGGESMVTTTSLPVIPSAGFGDDGPTFVLSSGRVRKPAEETLQAKAPTIDDEFEEYFSQLFL